LEGYFPIRHFCELSGISADTAYHRALRGTAPAFKDKSGKWFLYYCDDEPDCPEGYCSIDEYARIHNVNASCVRERLKRKAIPENDYIRKKIPVRDVKKGSRIRIFIKKDTPFASKAQLYRHSFNSSIYRNCPDGFMPLPEWIKQEGVASYDAYNWIRNEFLKTLKINRHYYIPNGITVESVYLAMDMRRKERKEWSQNQKPLPMEA